MQSTRKEMDAYIALFESAPVSIWYEDFSGVKPVVDGLKLSGNHLREYFALNRETLQECIRRIRILQVNRLALEFYGASTEEELIARLPDLFDDDSLRVFADELVALAGGNTRFQAEVSTRTVKGESRTVQMNISVLPTPDRPWSKVIVAFTDITERKRLEYELVQSQKLESLGRLAGGLAHDLNNALTIINGYSDMLLDEVPPPTEFHGNLREIKRAGERAAALIQQLLAFSRKQVLQPRVVNLNTIISDARNVLRTATGEHIDLVLTLDGALLPVQVDPAQFYHVLLNLVLNARDAMPDGGRIEIRTDNRRLLRDEDAGLPAGQYVTVSVKDTGVGIEESVKHRLFEPFFTTKEVGKGTGLGLSSALGIVQQSGGSIVASSEPGQGSEFTVYLPSTNVKENAAGPAPSLADLRGCETVLVVEDEPEVRSLLTETLRKYGYGVLASGTPREALEIFAAHRDSVHVLITDVVMPGMSGPQLVDTLSRDVPGLKVVYISGYATSPDLHTAPRGSKVMYLQKPFAATVLASAIRQLLTN
jgi:PAS domain S-box-containing protein